MGVGEAVRQAVEKQVAFGAAFGDAHAGDDEGNAGGESDDPAEQVRMKEKGLQDGRDALRSVLAATDGMQERGCARSESPTSGPECPRLQRLGERSGRLQADDGRRPLGAIEPRDELDSAFSAPPTSRSVMPNAMGIGVSSRCSSGFSRLYSTLMAERYYVPGLTESLREWVLDEEEAHHLLRVRRGKPGDAVQFFDGAGLRAEAVVGGVAKRTATLELKSFQRTAANDGLILGSRRRKANGCCGSSNNAAQLGVKSWTPIVSERTVVHPGDAKIDKLRRKVIETCKQCGRDRLMEIHEPKPLADFLSSKPTNEVGWLLDPSGDASSDAKAELGVHRSRRRWTADEIALAREHGWRSLHSAATCCESKRRARQWRASTARASGELSSL